MTAPAPETIERERNNMITVDQIPTDPTKFKTWADAACVAWPAELQAQAYRAWEKPAEHRQAFVAAYAAFVGSQPLPLKSLRLGPVTQ